MNELVVLTQGDVLAEVQGQVGLITLNRAKALNALSLDMVRGITKVLSAWQHDPRVQRRFMARPCLLAVSGLAPLPRAGSGHGLHRLPLCDGPRRIPERIEQAHEVVAEAPAR